jgi:hypothetical protein
MLETGAGAASHHQHEAVLVEGVDQDPRRSPVLHPRRQHLDAFTDLAREVFQGAVHGLRGIGAEIRRRSGRLRPYLHGARRHHLDCGVAPTGLLARPEHGS